MPVLAHADAAACVEAADQTQNALEQKHLLDAQTAATRCAVKECPDVVRADCNRWLKQLRRDIPSAVVRVVDRSGTEVADAHVEIRASAGGAPREVAAGETVELDPGAYTVAFSQRGMHGDATVTLAAGDKTREVVVLVEATTASKSTGKSEVAWRWSGCRRSRCCS